MMRILLQHISFSYDEATAALQDVDLYVESGAAIALVGANGSGKSTLLKIISGVLQPDRGAVTLDDQRLQALTARAIARRLAMVSQERSMGFDFTVREVVAMGRIPHRARFARESTSDRRAIEEAMKLADVHALAGRSIRAVSGGERQRVYLAMALAQEPRVLLLDEPTTHLDLHHQVQFMSIVRDRADAGLTVVIAIHDLTLAAQACDEIALMDEGRIVDVGPPEDVLTAASIRRAFSVDVVVGDHPSLGTVYVLPALSPRPSR